jgi:mannose-6-phosphate isomerase
MGTHPSAPSRTSDGESLSDVIARDPVAALGATTAERFDGRLPYLLKLLAAAQPLSLQAHPDAQQAAAGYAAEEAAGLARDAPTRNYVDACHKPELLVAVEEFDALCGFRDPDDSAAILESLSLPALDPLVSILRTGEVAHRLRTAVETLMAWPVADRAGLVSAVVASGHPLAGRLGRIYPDDIGVLVALLLNEVRLRPDEAVFMPAGNLHAYLSGFGVEVMAASDNVLRGGLTPKWVDPAELLSVLRYEVLIDPVVRPVSVAPGVVGWPAPVAEFSLIKADVSGVLTLPGTGPRILVCLKGTAQLRAGRNERPITAGGSVFVDAGEPAVEVASPDAVIFQAAAKA